MAVNQSAYRAAEARFVAHQNKMAKNFQKQYGWFPSDKQLSGYVSQHGGNPYAQAMQSGLRDVQRRAASGGNNRGAAGSSRQAMGAAALQGQAQQIFQQQQQQRLFDEFQQARDQANYANNERYQFGFDELGALRNRNMERIQTLGQQQLADTNRHFDVARDSSLMDLGSRGLRSSTIAPAVEQNVARERNDALRRVHDDITRQQIGTDASLTGGLTGFVERRNDVGPDFGQLGQLAQGLGQSGGQFSVPQFGGGARPPSITTGRPTGSGPQIATNPGMPQPGGYGRPVGPAPTMATTGPTGPGGAMPTPPASNLSRPTNAQTLGPGSFGLNYNPSYQGNRPAPQPANVQTRMATTGPTGPGAAGGGAMNQYQNPGGIYNQGAQGPAGRPFNAPGIVAQSSQQSKAPTMAGALRDAQRMQSQLNFAAKNANRQAVNFYQRPGGGGGGGGGQPRFQTAPAMAYGAPAGMGGGAPIFLNGAPGMGGGGMHAPQLGTNFQYGGHRPTYTGPGTMAFAQGLQQQQQQPQQPFDIHAMRIRNQTAADARRRALAEMGYEHWTNSAGITDHVLPQY